MKEASKIRRVMDFSLRVICANLQRRKDRKFALKGGFGIILGRMIEFYSAVDGSAIPIERVANYGPGVTPSNFAVRLTKRLILRNFLRSSQSHLLFLEDDVAFTPDFENCLEDALKLECDLVYLGGVHLEEPEPNGEWSKCRYLTANHCLLFTRDGAKKVLSILGEWNFPQSDVEIAENIRSGRLLAYCPPEWVAFQRDTTSNNCGFTGNASFAEGAIPYMLGDDLAVLDAALNEVKVVLEYGSGASTVHIGNRMKDWGTLLSIEHDAEWFQKVQDVLDDQGLDHVTLLLKKPRTGKAIQEFQRFSKWELQDYTSAPLEHLQEGEVDLIFVDGRQRIECALAAAPLLKTGGYLMIHDFWPRLRYRMRLSELLEHYDYLLESPCREQDQGLAVFVKK